MPEDCRCGMIRDKLLSAIGRRRTCMLEVSLAKKLVEQVTRYTDYNVNIMNESGVIIASRNPERVGSFHAAAWQILNGNEDIIIVSGDNDYSGTLRGINMVIEIDGRREGVVGVSGDPMEIRPVALMIKMAIQTLIKYENQKLQSIRRQSKKERFMEMLTKGRAEDPDHLRRLAKELNYREDIVRIPILCRPSHTGNQGVILSSIKESSSHRSEDISFALEDGSILIFKTMSADLSHMVSDYKYTLADYLHNTLKWLRSEGIGCRFYVGSFQDNFCQYYPAYQHCRWIEEHINTEHTAVYFYDHVQQYMQEMLPYQELQQAFNVFGGVLTEELKENYKELVGSLVRNDFRISDSAARLFMHKNTFVYRYNKIRDLLGVNPQNSLEDKGFLTYLYLYLMRKDQNG